MKREFKDFERCSKCGGRCCKIYLSCFDGGCRPHTLYFEEWVESWNEAFDDSGAHDYMKPQFDPLEVHLNDNQHLRDELKSNGIDPYACKYLGRNGCLLPWDNRPNACKEYRCTEWIRDVEGKSEN